MSSNSGSQTIKMRCCKCGTIIDTNEYILNSLRGIRQFKCEKCGRVNRLEIHTSPVYTLSCRSELKEIEKKGT
jgi:uncharacterized Zn finger protein